MLLQFLTEQAASTVTDNFWNITLGNLIALVVTLGGIILAAGKLIAGQNEVKKQTHELNSKFNDLNEHGTQFSQRGLSLEQSAIQSNTRRQDASDIILSKIVPDVAVIKTDVEWIKEALMSSVKVTRKRKA